MHLCNDNAQKWAVELAAIEANKRIAKPLETPPARSSSAVFLTETEKTVQINLSTLPKDKRRPVWDWIQQHRPQLAEMLSNDANLSALKQTFSATVSVQIPEADARDLGIIR